MVNGPNGRAFAKTVAELRRMGRLEQVDAARVQALRTMAQTLDARSGNANLWKVYHEALERLITGERDSGDATERLLAELSGDVGNSSSS